MIWMDTLDRMKMKSKIDMEAAFFFFFFGVLVFHSIVILISYFTPLVCIC